MTKHRLQPGQLFQLHGCLSGLGTEAVLPHTRKSPAKRYSSDVIRTSLAEKIQYRQAPGPLWQKDTALTDIRTLPEKSQDNSAIY
jgi:hypothetical protein